MLSDQQVILLMKRAAELAEQGRGRVSPNPMVGACIVNKDGEILAEGWHKDYGGKHAEINAIESAIAAGITDFSGLSLICTLEPCNVWGKTPPCTSAIIKSGFKKIFIGIKDPNPRVNGGGIKVLKEAGLAVRVGFIENILLEQNAGFIKVMKSSRPLITLKLAVSTDGYLSEGTAVRTKITDEAQDRLVHSLRAGQDAILIGIGTVRADDPILTVRNGITRPKPLTRVIIDPNISIDLGSVIVKTACEVPTMLIVAERSPADIARTSQKNSSNSTSLHLKKVSKLSDSETDQKISSLKKFGVEVIALPATNSRIDLRILSKKLAELGICYLLVEGGERIATSFLKAGLVDRLVLFYGNKIIRSDAKGIATWPTKQELADLSEGDGLDLVNNRFKLTQKNTHFLEFLS